jgi:hypothetical protein
MIRNILVVVGSVIVGMIVMQPFMVAERYATEGRTFEGVAGTLLMHLIVLVPSLAAAAAMGAVAALGMRTSRPGAWAAASAAVVAFLLALSWRYVAPDWGAWLTTIVAIVVPSLAAWCLFTLVWRARNRSRSVV